MKIFWRLSFLLCITLAMLACSQDHFTNIVGENGSLPIRMSLEPAQAYGFVVTRVSVSIMSEDVQRTMDLSIDSTSASGTFEDLTPGTYSVFVNVYQDSLLIATGSGIAQVIPGQDSVVHITLQMVNGGLTVVVDWGDIIPLLPQHVLFVGNSHTYYNGGVNVHVLGMLRAAHPGWNFTTAAETIGGGTLNDHWHSAETMAAIRSGLYDMVILQESSRVPIDQPDSFRTYAGLIHGVIDSVGARTGFYMTQGWLNYPGMIDSLALAYTQEGAALNAVVCPAGLAWERARDLDPQISLYAADNYHPNALGTYLSSCVIYATLWHESPVGNTYVSNVNITAEQRLFLQTVAWETVCEYFGWSE